MILFNIKRALCSFKNKQLEADMKDVLGITGYAILIILIVVLTFDVLSLNGQCSKQGQQIEQLSQMAITLAKNQGAEDSNGFVAGKEYCLFFVDYSKGIAVVGEFEGQISYDKNPRWLIMRNINEDMLVGWSKEPVLYGKYRKIP